MSLRHANHSDRFRGRGRRHMYMVLSKIGPEIGCRAGEGAHLFPDALDAGHHRASGRGSDVACTLQTASHYVKLGARVTEMNQTFGL